MNLTREDITPTTVAPLDQETLDAYRSLGAEAAEIVKRALEFHDRLTEQDADLDQRYPLEDEDAQYALRVQAGSSAVWQKLCDGLMAAIYG